MHHGIFQPNFCSISPQFSRRPGCQVVGYGGLLARPSFVAVCSLLGEGSGQLPPCPEVGIQKFPTPGVPANLAEVKLLKWGLLVLAVGESRAAHKARFFVPVKARS